MVEEEDVWKLEEAFEDQDRKAMRKEKKRLIDKDRSRFKKTDLDQRNKIRAQHPMPKEQSVETGRVLAIYPKGIVVNFEGQDFLCKLKGSLKQEKNRIKNLIAVGDFVQVEKRDHQEGRIVNVLPRRSILSRADNLSRLKEQLIAVNIDQVLITSSVVFPPLKASLIDRYIIAAQKGNMEPILVINKIDLLTDLEEKIDPHFLKEQKEVYLEFLEAYRKLDFKIVPVSVKTQEGIGLLKEVMKNKTSVFSGQSGTGKSSLINCTTGQQFATGGIVERTGKGSHTTTTTHLVALEQGGFCIDTPGIKSFGIWDLKETDFSACYPEIAKFASLCKYPNCRHLNEPDCAVKQGVENQEISLLRFNSYCSLIQSLKIKHQHR